MRSPSPFAREVGVDVIDRKAWIERRLQNMMLSMPFRLEDSVQRCTRTIRKCFLRGENASSNKSNLNRGLKFSLLIPAPSDLLEKLPLKEAAELLSSRDSSLETDRWLLPWSQTSLALARLRSGEYAEALKLCNEVAGDANDNTEAKSLAIAISALSLAKQGNVDEARQQIDKFKRFRSFLPHNHDQLTSDLLRREAEQILAGDAHK